MEIEKYVGKTIDCPCGKKHSSKVETIVIRENVIQEDLVAYLKSKGFKMLTVVCDKQTYQAAGQQVCVALDEACIAYKLHTFTEETVIPNEHFIGNLAVGLALDSDLVLAVGSGTINDICRYVSAVAKIPYCVVGTAPSMDGYISGGSALIYNGCKLTFETRPPMAAFLDPEILAKAPMDMIASGVGDLLGKINCLADWQLSNLITGEWHCAFIANIVDTAVKKVTGAAAALGQRNTNAMADLVEGLLLSGVCMDFAGNSRPASGAEHHISHFLEMRFLQEGREGVFHGTKVGIGTVITLKAYEYVSRLKPDFDKLQTLPRESFDRWEEKIRTAFLGAAQEVVELEKTGEKNGKKRLQQRLAAIREKWQSVRAMAEGMTKHTLVQQLLENLDAPTKLAQIGVDKEMARQAILYAKELRDRYTVLQLLWDLGELENFANELLEEY